MIRAAVLHRLPGRLRIRGDALCGQDAALRAIEQELSAFAGVMKVTGNNVTGSVLIEYDADVLSDGQLLVRLRQTLDFTTEESATDSSDPVGDAPVSDSPKVAAVIQSPFDRVDEMLKELSDGFLDLRYSVPVVFIVLGTWKVLMSSSPPGIPWYMYYWMSYRLFANNRTSEKLSSYQKPV